MKLFTLVFPFLALFVACHKDETDPAEDIKNVLKADYALQTVGDYPSIYPLIEPAQLKPLQETYRKRNPYMYTGLNTFGFCGFEETDFTRDVPFPNGRLPIDEEQATGIFKKFMSRNFVHLGLVDSTQDLPGTVNSDCVQSDTCIGWSFESVNQVVGGMEVLDTRIVMHIFNKQMISCTGNWYPDVQIPDRFNITSDEAKDKLNGRTVVHYSISGEPYYVTIHQTDIENCITKNVIVPVKDEKSIMLRVTWEFNFKDPVYYKICVDVMTGEIVMAVPTIIS